MPRVPRISEDRIKATGIPSVRVSADAPLEAFGGGQSAENVNRATQGITNTIAKIQLEEQNKADDASLFEASSRMAQMEVDLGKKRLQYRGKSALSYPDEEAKIVSSTIQDINDNLPNDRVRTRFSEVARQYDINIQKQTNSYVFQEKERYEAETFESFVQNERNSILSSFSDDARIAKGILTQAIAINNYGKERYGEEWVKQKTDETASDVHIGVIMNRASVNPESAIEYFNKNKDGILPDKRDRVISDVKELVQRQAKENDIRSDYNKQQSFEAMRSEIDSPNFTYADKRQKIEDAVKYGILDSDDGKFMEKYLNSNNKLEATTYDENITGILIQIDDIDNGISKDSKLKDINSYIKGVKSLRQLILQEHADGKITSSDKDTAIKKLNETVMNEEDIISNKLRKANKDSYKYKESYQSFLKAFNNDAVKAQYAMKEYFYSSADKDNISKEERANLRSQIIDKTRVSFREKALSDIKKSTPSSQHIFNTPAEADNSGLPKGTVVIVGNRRYEI